LGDYVTCYPRYGTNELLANSLFLNKNLFIGNLRSLKYFPHHTANILKYSIEDSLKRKSSFNQRALALRFNQRALALRSNIPLQNRKRIFNPHIETEDEFQRRRKLNLTAPWEDAKIREVIKAENSEKGENIIYGPKGLDKLIDDLEKN
jgi:hypothetical protein